MQQSLLYYINSPLDQFEIRSLIGINSPFINITLLNITTFSLYTLILLILIYLLFTLSTNNNKLLGSRWMLVQESINDTIINIVKNQIGGKNWGYYYPIIFTMFMFIFMLNLISIIPYSFALTSHIIFVVSLSITIWIGLTIIGLYNHGWNFFSLFVPLGTPLPLVPLLVLIELLSYVARALSLGLRLSANVLAGHLLLIILAGLLFNLISINIMTFTLLLLPFLGILGIVCLEFLIAIIQAYVWCILMSSYLKDALYLH